MYTHLNLQKFHPFGSFVIVNNQLLRPILSKNKRSSSLSVFFFPLISVVFSYYVMKYVDKFVCNEYKELI